MRLPGLKETNSDFLLKWTPRALAAALGSYYGLGIAYEVGLMSLIDRVAIRVIKNFLGYAGVGALMPSIQWYSAWGCRFAIGIGAGLLYDWIEKSVSFFSSKFSGSSRAIEPRFKSEKLAG